MDEHTHTHTHIYKHREREREREREITDLHVNREVKIDNLNIERAKKL